MANTAMVRSFYFYPDVLASHLYNNCSDIGLVKHHMRTIEEAAREYFLAKIVVQERHVDSKLLQSMTIRNIPDTFMTRAGECDPNSMHALFPLDMISALKKFLVSNHHGHHNLNRSFNAIEEFLVDKMINKCALSQGSGDWCSFVSLRRNDWDVNENIDWAALCDEANKVTSQNKHRHTSASGSTKATAADNKEGDARFARIIQSLLMEFGIVAVAAFFRLQDRKYHYYCVTLPLQQ